MFKVHYKLETDPGTSLAAAVSVMMSTQLKLAGKWEEHKEMIGRL